MIRVTRLNQEEFYVNSDLIEFIEERPDTTISMESGRKILVTESAQEVLRRILAYRRSILANLPRIEESNA